MVIESYQFGSISISGTRYNSDVIIYEDRVNSNWRRKDGHLLSPDDLKEVIEANPEIIIVGTGCYGVMKIPKNTEKFLDTLGINLEARNTKEACDLYNELSKTKKVIACLHLTC